MKTNKKKTGIIVFSIILILALGIVALYFFQGRAKKDPSAKFSSSEFIAAIYVEGVIENRNATYNQEWLLTTIDNLKNNSKNVGIALFINSPGGGVYQSDEVYLALQDYKTANKKVYAYMGSLAASGGYYISCAAEKIYANRNTLTGSIGVIAGQSFDMTELMKNIGIKSETFFAGRNKNMLNFNQPVTQEQRAIMQGIADECYKQFVGIVTNQRKLPYEKVEELADGRIYTAYQAIQNGLIDKIDSWENMIDDLCDDLEKPECKVKTFQIIQKQSFLDKLLTSKTEANNTKIAAQLGIPLNVYKELSEPIPYPAYLYK
jgi:protease-4